MNTTLYKLTSPSGKTYLGITSRGLDQRWHEHCYDAERGRKTPLCIAIRKYGAHSFDVRSLAILEWEEANRIEALLIARMGTQVPVGYNLREGGSRSRLHAQTRAKMREAKLGTKHSAETRAKMSAARKGRPMPAAQKAAVAANTGAKRTPEQRERMRQAALRRKTASPKARANMSAAAKAAWKPGGARRG